nr:immunoglobulin light chain junction region [Macaca mulatta]
CQHDYSTPYSF